MKVGVFTVNWKKKNQETKSQSLVHWIFDKFRSIEGGEDLP